MAAARFALRPGTISDEYGNNHELVVLNIDELCVLPSHRCRGFAYTCFYSILQQLQVNNMYSSISAMQIKVVEGSWQMQKLVAGGFACRDHTVSAQITEAMNAESVQIKMVPMLLSMSCESKDSLLGYLRQRSNIG